MIRHHVDGHVGVLQNVLRRRSDDGSGESSRHSITDHQHVELRLHLSTMVDNLVANVS